MITTTARQLIAGALKIIGVLDASEAADAADEADCLRMLHSLIDSWGTQRQTIFTVTRSTYTWTANTTSFTIGTGASFSQQRPVWIDNAAYVIPDSDPATEVPLWILTDQQYADQSVKPLTATLPSWLYYNPTSPVATGYGTLYLGPIPTQNVTLVLYWPTAVVQFTDLTTSYILPPSYERALRTNLGVEVAPMYGVKPQVIELVLKQATDSLADVKRANTRLYDLQMDPALVDRLPALWNIYAGP